MRKINLNIKELKQFYELGLSQKEISKKFGVCRRTIWRRFKEVGYKCRSNINYKNGLMSKKLSSKELMINKRRLYPEKVKARETLRYHIKKGNIIKPNICSICKKIFDSKSKIQGHHKNYNQPLKVVWCCNKCHWGLENK